MINIIIIIVSTHKVRQILIDYILYYRTERRRTYALSKIIGAGGKR